MSFDLYSICTSHVERCNLTIRTCTERFTRLALGFSKKLENLAAAVALHVAHYNFCRVHGSLEVTTKVVHEGPPVRPTVEPLARTYHVWEFEELYDAVMG